MQVVALWLRVFSSMIELSTELKYNKLMTQVQYCVTNWGCEVRRMWAFAWQGLSVERFYGCVDTHTSQILTTRHAKLCVEQADKCCLEAASQ